MRNPRTKSFTHFIIVIAGLILLYLINNIGPRKSTKEQVSELNSKHKGAIVFLKSDTEKDKPFKEALNEIRTELKGKAGIVIASRGKKEGSQSGIADLSPALIIIDAHGNEMYRFVNSLDRKVLDELVQQLTIHHH